MKVFSTADLKAAVVINSPEMSCMQIKMDDADKGVCVHVYKNNLSIYAASIYCRFGEPLEDYLNYLERLLHLVGGRPLLIGMDAKAVSPMWHSKTMQIKYDECLVA